MKPYLYAGVLAVMISGSAAAQDTGIYVSGELGAAPFAHLDTTFTPAVLPDTSGDLETDHSLGLQASLLGGYDFGPVRLEAEGLYIEADVDGFTSSFGGTSVLAIGSQSGGGQVRATGYMINGVWDAYAHENFEFFLGAGAGQARLRAMVGSTQSNVMILDDEDQDRRFAWQVFGGVRRQLTSNIDGYVRYRYLSVEGAEFVGFGGRFVEADFSSHALSAGVTFRF